ncbi:MAG: tRNA delta(2)-isopentenylpyrophosphate transferase, tRNA dimethylallyltransferase [Candidatus Parcubacteria bacterium]|jgi:tRNA dimethylallyltransferase
MTLHTSRSDHTKPKLLVVLGPTAVGKSDLAVELALRFNGEVISADSRQVYKQLDIGTGKITKKEMKKVPHHLLDVVSAKKVFSVSDFQKKAMSAADDIISRGKLPILCGGTGFYIQSLVDGVVLPEVPPNEALRKKLSKKSAEKLYDMLLKIDQERAADIDKHNPVRLIRAIEIAKALGRVPKAVYNSPFSTLQIGLDISDELLKAKIHKRLLARLKKGMLKEAQNLHAAGLSWKRMEMLGLEYRYMALFLQKKISKQEMIERLTFDIWHYAKRQRTWFKRDARIKWFSPTPKDLKKISKEVKDFLK